MSCTLRKKIGLRIVVLLILALYPTSNSQASQPLQARLDDGVILKVHFKGNPGAQGRAYAQEVLQAACAAYEEVVFVQGFSRDGYTFASADKFFAYDGDQAIDVYIEDVQCPYAKMTPRGGLEYQAAIFIPADYKKYRERYRVSNPRLELKAALTHEILHIITYSYNRNMQATSAGKSALISQNWDWYTEGLARYFEALAGYRTEYLSSGFRKTSGKKVTVYKGGVNYFLKNPDKPLDERKYDFALFWQYLHQNYGMENIEEISCQFREIDPALSTNREAMQIIARTLGVELESLLQDFSLYLYEISTLAGKRQNGFKAVHISRLLSCRNTALSYNISSFGFDFYEIDLRQGLKSVRVQSLKDKKSLACVVAVSNTLDLQLVPVEDCNSEQIEIDTSELPKNSKMIIMLANPTDENIPYRISTK